jgi:membrane protease YdiL (CAAX protease family)
MSQDNSTWNDLQTAAVLGWSAGLLGAVTIPFLLPSISELVPPEQRTLPVPLPLFCTLLAIFFLVIYGLVAFAGLRPERKRGRELAPLLSAIWTKKSLDRFGLPAGLAFGTGILCGIALVGATTLIKWLLPQTLPSVLHPSSLRGALLASATASFGEEILFRLFLLSGLLRVLPLSGKSTMIAVAASSLLFGAFHAPAAVFFFGGLHNGPPLTWVWVVSLNGLVGVACAVWYLRVGIGCTILVHFGADLGWHVLSQL